VILTSNLQSPELISVDKCWVRFSLKLEEVGGDEDS